MPLYKNEATQRAIDRLLIEQRMLAGLDDFEMVLDDKTARTVQEMERLQQLALANRDYELLAKLRKDIKDLKMGQVEREKCAIEYETSEFEDMILFGD